MFCAGDRVDFLNSVFDPNMLMFVRLLALLAAIAPQWASEHRVTLRDSAGYRQNSAGPSWAAPAQGLVFDSESHLAALLPLCRISQIGTSRILAIPCCVSGYATTTTRSSDEADTGPVYTINICLVDNFLLHFSVQSVLLIRRNSSDLTLHIS